MISPVLHQISLHCPTSTVIFVFTPQIQSSHKIKRADFTEVLLSLPFGPLKIACHKGAFDMLNICVWHIGGGLVVGRSESLVLIPGPGPRGPGR